MAWFLSLVSTDSDILFLAIYSVSLIDVLSFRCLAAAVRAKARFSLRGKPPPRTSISQRVDLDYIAAGSARSRSYFMGELGVEGLLKKSLHGTGTPDPSSAVAASG
jgi:hypothetical protein